MTRRESATFVCDSNATEISKCKIFNFCGIKPVADYDVSDKRLNRQHARYRPPLPVQTAYPFSVWTACPLNSTPSGVDSMPVTLHPFSVWTACPLSSTLFTVWTRINCYKQVMQNLNCIITSIGCYLLHYAGCQYLHNICIFFSLLYKANWITRS